MPFGSVQLVPGLNVERTPVLLRAGYSSTSLGRFRDGLFQKIGGWTAFYPFNLSGVPRDLHSWEDLNENKHLSVGTTGLGTRLNVITAGSLLDITPQTFTSNFTPGISTTINSPVVSITDPNISNVTVFDSVFFNVPVSIGGLILDGLYQITEITGVNSYQITAPTNATSNSSSSSIPIFTTANGSSNVTVGMTANGVAVGDVVVFPVATTFNGVTIQGSYDVVTVSNPNLFSITAATQATASGSQTMNGGQAQLIYYIALGPPPIGSGYGLGGYGLGGYGTGTSTGVQTGSKIVATDWTSDNWGQILLACPQNGPVYFWDPTGGFQNAQVVASGPPINTAIFVSMAQQILVTLGSSVHQAIGWQQQPLLVQWSDVSNFFDFTATTANQAGNDTISNGSLLVAGMAVSNQNLIWTDQDLWAMSYIGPPDVYGFNKIGAGMGLVSSHAAQALRGSVYWMSPNNFCSYTSNGSAIIPCPIWDAVFQNINTNFIQNVRAMPNTPFNECGWLYPSAASVSGENDSYVKMNITEPGAPWDYGPASSLPAFNRSAWIDQGVLGNPIGATPTGTIYQHEMTNDANGQPITSGFTTGYFYLAEGEDFVTVDQVYPDFKWTTFGASGSAQIQLTFLVVNNPDDVPTPYGPFTVTQGSPAPISVRFRGRMMALQVSSSDVGSFWRLGNIKYRYSVTGRR